jgi:pSer/pThr/pTyr-binding forkhead associated (FHA) protein
MDRPRSGTSPTRARPRKDSTVPERLIERSGDRIGRIRTLGPELVSIGRGEDNVIVVAEEHASRHHAQVAWDRTQYIVRDLGSKNGTFVNGHRIEGVSPLRHGDVITVPGLTLVFDAADDTATLGTDIRPAGGIRVDTSTAEVWANGRRVQLTAKEYQAVALLYRMGGALVTKQDLAVQVWPEHGGAVGDSNIEQLIYRLRRKLEEDPEHPRFLITMRGLGYRLMTK